MEREFAKLFVIVQAVAEKLPTMIKPPSTEDDDPEADIQFPLRTSGALSDLEIRLSSDSVFQRKIVSFEYKFFLKYDQNLIFVCS